MLITANILNLSPESAERKIQLAGLLASLLFRQPSHLYAVETVAMEIMPKNQY